MYMYVQKLSCDSHVICCTYPQADRYTLLSFRSSKANDTHSSRYVWLYIHIIVETMAYSMYTYTHSPYTHTPHTHTPILQAHISCLLFCLTLFHSPQSASVRSLLWTCWRRLIWSQNVCPRSSSEVHRCPVIAARVLHSPSLIWNNRKLALRNWHSDSIR